MTPTLSDGETAMAQCPEPSVDDMVDDPIVRALMAADGVDRRQLRRLLRSIAENLRLRRVESPQRTASRVTDAKKSAARKKGDRRRITHRARLG
jgi:hypothetical protein